MLAPGESVAFKSIRGIKSSEFLELSHIDI